ncbi:MAG: S9 family peptidase, partial [Balneolaceae bacterium]
MTPAFVLAQEQVTADDYARAESMLGANTGSLIYNVLSGSTWLDDGRLVYRNSISGGAEFIIADPQSGNKEPAFDHERLAEGLSEATGDNFEALMLPFRSFDFRGNGNSITFTIRDKTYECSLNAYSCNTTEGAGAST